MEIDPESQIESHPPVKFESPRYLTSPHKSPSVANPQKSPASVSLSLLSQYGESDSEDSCGEGEKNGKETKKTEAEVHTINTGTKCVDTNAGCTEVVINDIVNMETVFTKDEIGAVNTECVKKISAPLVKNYAIGVESVNKSEIEPKNMEMDKDLELNEASNNYNSAFGNIMADILAPLDKNSYNISDECKQSCPPNIINQESLVLQEKASDITNSECSTLVSVPGDPSSMQSDEVMVEVNTVTNSPSTDENNPIGEFNDVPLSNSDQVMDAEITMSNTADSGPQVAPSTSGTLVNVSSSITGTDNFSSQLDISTVPVPSLNVQSNVSHTSVTSSSQMSTSENTNNPKQGPALNLNVIGGSENTDKLHKTPELNLNIVGGSESPNNPMKGVDNVGTSETTDNLQANLNNDSELNNLDNPQEGYSLDVVGGYRYMATYNSGTDDSESDSEPSKESDSSSSASSSSSEESEEEPKFIAAKIFKPKVEEPSKKKDKMLTKGEISIDDLPPIEDLCISVPEEKAHPIGTIQSIVEQQVVIAGYRKVPPIDLESVLFLKRGLQALGRVFDVFGPVEEPLYVVRFNSPQHVKEAGVECGQQVFFAPSTDYTNFIILDALMKLRGTDASGQENNEPDDGEIQDFSDDEQEARMVGKASSHPRYTSSTDEPRRKCFRRRDDQGSSPNPFTGSGRGNRGRGRGRGGEKRPTFGAAGHHTHRNPFSPFPPGSHHYAPPQFNGFGSHPPPPHSPLAPPGVSSFPPPPPPHHQFHPSHSGAHNNFSHHPHSSYHPPPPPSHPYQIPPSRNQPRPHPPHSVWSQHSSALQFRGAPRFPITSHPPPPFMLQNTHPQGMNVPPPSPHGFSAPPQVPLFPPNAPPPPPPNAPPPNFGGPPPSNPYV